jgi:hypothetical protein
VAAEAHADGLLSPTELRDTVAELRGTYAAQLAALGVDAATLPDPADDSDDDDALLYDDAEDEDDDEDEEEEEYEDARRGGGQARSRGACAALFRAAECFVRGRVFRIRAAAVRPLRAPVRARRARF